MEDVEVCECSEDQLDWHELVHESGHVIAALDHGVRFLRILLWAEGQGPLVGNGLRRATAMTVMADGWVRADPVASFHVTAAGKAAEECVIGHESGAYGVDLGVWFRGLEHRGTSMTDDEFIGLVGVSADVVDLDLANWATGSQGRIERLAAYLEAIPRPAGPVPADVSYEDLAARFSAAVEPTTAPPLGGAT
jgi:hypothetical protein